MIVFLTGAAIHGTAEPFISHFKLNKLHYLMTMSYIESTLVDFLTARENDSNNLLSVSSVFHLSHECL